jgi:hypothetical protein
VHLLPNTSSRTVFKNFTLCAVTLFCLNELYSFPCFCNSKEWCQYWPNVVVEIYYFSEKNGLYDFERTRYTPHSDFKETQSNFIFCIGTFRLTMRYLGITFPCNAVIPCNKYCKWTLIVQYIPFLCLPQTNTHSHSPTAVCDNTWLTLHLTFQSLQDEEIFGSSILTERAVSYLCSGMQFKMHCVVL